MTTTYLRQAKAADLPAIMQIIAEAKAYLKQQKIDQWQSGYPGKNDIAADVAAGLNYVMLRDGELVGTASLHQGRDEDYQVIQGRWRGAVAQTYTSIHRMGVAAGYRGQHLSESLITNLLTLSVQLGYTDVRVDTHPENKVMQHVLAQCGFDYRGIVHYASMPQQPLYAYQLQLND